MSKGVKSLLWTASILFVLALVIFAAIKVFFPAEKVKAIIVSKIEESLNRPVTVGEASVTIWGGIGLQISDLKVKNHTGFNTEDFMALDRLEVGLKFWPLLKGKYVFSKFKLDGLTVNLEKQPGGGMNFSDLGRHEETAVEPAAGVSSIPFLFDKLELHNTRLNFLDDSLGMTFALDQIDLVSKLSENGFDDSYQAEGEFSVGNLRVGQKQKQYEFPNLKVRGDMKLKLDLKKGIVVIDKFIVHLADLQGQLEGQVSSIFHSPGLELSFRSKKFTTQQILALIPQDLHPVLTDISGSGEMTFSADLKGALDKTDNLDMRARMLFENIQLNSPRIDGDFVIHSGEISLRQKAVSFLFESCTFGNEPFSAKIYLADFTDPKLTAELAFSMNLHSFKKYSDEIDELSGRAYGNINIFADLKNPENTWADGGLVVEDLRLHHGRLPEAIEEVDFECEFKRKDITVEKCDAEIGESRLSLQGQMIDIIPFLASPRKGKYAPYFLLDLRADYLNLDQLLEFLPVDSTVYTSTPAGQSLGDKKMSAIPSDSLPAFSAKGLVRADRGRYTGIDFEDLSANLDYRDKILHLEQIDTKLYGGSARGEVIVDYENLREPKFQIDIEASEVEINSILSRLTGLDDVFFGKVEMKSSFAGIVGDPMQVINQITANGKVSMNQGAIRNFPLLQNVSSQLGLKTFTEEKIRDLRNTFTIADGKIRFDDFVMIVSGSEWNIDGQAGFDGSLDYNLGITLDQNSLTNSEALKNLGSLLGVKNDKVIIPVKLSGNYKEPNIEVDRSRLTESADKKVKEEGQKLLNNLLKKK